MVEKTCMTVRKPSLASTARTEQQLLHGMVLTPMARHAPTVVASSLIGVGGTVVRKLVLISVEILLLQFELDADVQCDERQWS
ncbi:hypothetical protein PoB_002978600 [Plakobranchus ocellatus]|uniref:Uncharacterized protein n=1 Tax=Plakobranchus ocellatus TaxID=259542 RepID=A0AAV3ZWE2_9GAST|nr:hypothetical protein PoB_002978600 [Plakobranchus ocellatus]